MLVAIPEILDQDQVALCRERLDQADWQDGRITAGPQSAQAKANQPQIQHHDCGQKHRESQQMEGLNHRHAELAIANENDRRPVGDGLKKRKKMHIRIDEL